MLAKAVELGSKVQPEIIPVLSVCVVTYNQERYIRPCLQSIIEQEVVCGFEIIVGDDCSTDSTREIIQEFHNNYPNLFHVILQESNVGFTKNMYDVYGAARGKYIAHIDGDDVMLPGKLQHQVIFLDDHPNCSMVTHDVQVVNDTSNIISDFWVARQIPELVDLSYLVQAGCFFPHSSKMFRSSARRTRYEGKPVVDFCFHIEHAQSGLVGYINEVLGQYRKTNSGITSATSCYRLILMRCYLDAYELALAAGVNPEIVRQARISFRYINAMSSLRAGDISGFKLMVDYDYKDRKLLSRRERLVYWMVRWPKTLAVLIKVFDRITKTATFES